MFSANDGSELAKYTLIPAGWLTPKRDPLLGLHFGNVLGDALRTKRRFARRLSHVTRRPSRHRVRPELVHVLRESSGAAVRSRVGRGDDIARPTDLLRPAGHGSVRSGHVGRAADLGAVGRQHHRGARRSREPRSGPRRGRRGVRDSGAVRGYTSVPHNRAGRARGLRGSATRTDGSIRGSPRCHGRHVGYGGGPTCLESGHAVERGDPGHVGPTRTPGGEPRNSLRS